MSHNSTGYINEMANDSNGSSPGNLMAGAGHPRAPKAPGKPGMYGEGCGVGEGISSKHKGPK